MNAAKIAHQLKLLGVDVIKVEEPCDVEDGAVYVTDKLHVQVPDEGRDLGIVEELDDGCFRFGALTESVTKIADQIKAELAPAQFASTSTS